MTSDRINAFLSDAGWDGALRTPLAGDASARCYDRVRRGGQSAVLMMAPLASDADRASFAAFLDVADLLRASGLAAPEVFSVDAQAGLILMQDFGDISLAQLLQDGSATDAYRQAAVVPDHLATIMAPDWVVRPTPAEQANMARLTFGFLPEAHALAADVTEGLHAALTRNASGPPVLALRDFHADNLIWRPSERGIARIGLLDFQDAVLLPVGYDLASLVDDPRRRVPDDLRTDLIARFATTVRLPMDEALARIDTLSLLRNLRILGIFHRLSLTGKPAYRQFLPRTVELMQNTLRNPDLAPLRVPVAATLELAAGWANGTQT